jgi:hypothetical protein
MLGLGIGCLDRRYLGLKCLDRTPTGEAWGKGKEEHAGKGARAQEKWRPRTGRDRAREKPRPGARLREEIEHGRSGPTAAERS